MRIRTFLAGGFLLCAMMTAAAALLGIYAFVDLRGFTAFTETSDPEDVMRVLGEYHEAMGQLVMAYGGTLEHFAGDGMMIYFNDPVEVENPAGVAVRMAIAMQERFSALVHLVHPTSSTCTQGPWYLTV